MNRITTKLCSLSFAAIAVACSSVSYAGLIDRGSGLIYDDVLDITWLQDANYAVTSGYAAGNFKSDTGSATDDILLDGSMGWDAATAWVTGLSYAGNSGWRLPTLTDLGLLGCVTVLSYSGGDCGYNVNTTSGEMASLYYDSLTNLAFFDTSGIGPQVGWTGTPNSGPFLNVQAGIYWYGTEHGLDNTRAWQFSFHGGSQAFDLKSTEYFAWAVRDGDVCSGFPGGGATGGEFPGGGNTGGCFPGVPEPSTLILLGLGLAGLGMNRRRRPH